MSEKKHSSGFVKELIQTNIVMCIIFIFIVGVFCGFKYDDTEDIRKYDKWVVTQATFYGAERYEVKDEDTTNFYYMHYFRYLVDGEEYTFTRKRRNTDRPESEIISVVYAEEDPYVVQYGNNPMALSNKYDLLIWGSAGFLLGLWTALNVLAFYKDRIYMKELPQILADLEADYNREHDKKINYEEY